MPRYMEPMLVCELGLAPIIGLAVLVERLFWATLRIPRSE